MANHKTQISSLPIRTSIPIAELASVRQREYLFSKGYIHRLKETLESGVIPFVVRTIRVYMNQTVSVSMDTRCGFCYREGLDHVAANGNLIDRVIMVADAGACALP